MTIINKYLETKILKVLKNHDLIFLPGELESTNKTVNSIEENYSSYDKIIHVDKKKLKIYKYERIIDQENRNYSFMMIMDYKDLRFFYRARTVKEAISSLS